MSDLFNTDNNINNSADSSPQSNIKLASSNTSEFLNINSKAKELTEQVEWVITHRKTEYLAELLGLQNHKSVSIRRRVANSLGKLGQLSNVVDIQNWMLVEPDRQTLLTLEVAVDKLTRRITQVDSGARILTVTEALSTIKKTISEKEYTIEGELAEVKVISSMYYFALKDAQDTRIDCTVYSGKALGFGFPINEGWAVQITGKFRISKTGRLQLDVYSMKLTGEGELKRNLELLQKKLESEGLFDESRKRKLNILPQKILLLASSSSAALQDFQKILLSRRRGITIYYLPIKTQGVGAEYEILTRLDLANYFCEKHNIDTVVLTRGGGSKDDLMVFNSEKIVRAIHSLNRPTIVAIGHERDICLAEMVADKRASTPSNAAELCSISEVEVVAELQNISNRLHNYFLERQNSYVNFGNNIVQQIHYGVKSQIAMSYQVCQKTEQTIFYSLQNIRNLVQQTQNTISRYVQNQLQITQNNIPNLQYFVINLQTKIHNDYNQLEQNLCVILQNMNFRIQKNLQENQNIFNRLSLQDPKKILNMGYAIISQNGKPVSKIKSIGRGGLIAVEMQDGQTSFTKS